MADDPKGPVEGTEEPENPESPDLSAWQKQITDEFDKRFSGIQSILDRRDNSINELKDIVETLKTANLSPEEQEQLSSDKRAAEVAALKRENEILKMRKEYPDEVDFLQTFLGSQSLEDQFKALRDYKKPKEVTPPPAEGDEGAEEAPPVMSNNSRRDSKISAADLSGQMTEKLAKKLLEDTSEDRGILARLRRKS